MIELGLEDAETGKIIGRFEFVSCPAAGETVVVREAYMHRYAVEHVEHWPKHMDRDPAGYHAETIAILRVRSLGHFDPQ